MVTPSPASTYLEELMYRLRDALAVHRRVREIDQNPRRLFLRRLELASLALLGHFRRLLAVHRIYAAPFLDPFMCRLCSFNHSLSRNVFLLSRREEFEQFNLLFGIELRP